jgi:hypothetical protein
MKKKHFRCIMRITRQALVDPSLLHFLNLYHSRCTQSTITYTGFDYEFFDLPLLLFTYFNEFTLYSNDGNIVRIKQGNGRKRLISALVCLGMVLVWTQSRDNIFSLQLDFGLSHSCLTLWLRFGMRIIMNVLHDHPLACVKCHHKKR